MNTKAQGLPINIIVMLILGLFLFGLGLGLFAQLSTSSEETVQDLNNRIKADIASLECQGDQWVCSPSHKIRNGAKETFEVFVANKGDVTQRFTLTFTLDEIEAGKFGIQNDCGAILITRPDQDVNILSGNSASFPFVVRASRVGETPCSFVTTVTAVDESSVEVGKTPVIIRVE